MRIGPKNLTHLITLCMCTLSMAGCSDPAEEARLEARKKLVLDAVRMKEERAKAEEAMAAEIAAAVYRPRNTNPNAYTETGGFRTDDPVPQQLPGSALGNGEVVVSVTPLSDMTLMEYLSERFLEMGVGARGWQTIGKYQVDFKLKGVKDANEVAAIIDFGDVVNIDQNRIEVKLAPSQMPHPELPFGTSPFASKHDYTSQHLIDTLDS